MKWTHDKPKKTGWYWFHVGHDSPAQMTRNTQAIVFVGAETTPGWMRLRCRFPQGDFRVEVMGGMWAGPIDEPSEAAPDA
jgi:hypothetical protein